MAPIYRPGDLDAEGADGITRAANHVAIDASQNSQLRIAQVRFLKLSAAKPRRGLDEATLAVLVKAVVARYPDYGNEYFLELGIPAVWEKLASH